MTFQPISTGMLSLILALVGNMVAIVWGAATMSANIRNLTATVKEMKNELHTTITDVTDLKIRLNTLERLGITPKYTAAQQSQQQ